MKFTIPVLLLKNLVILPNQEIKIELNNKITRKIIKNATLHTEGKLLVVAPIDAMEEEPSVDDLPRVGVIASIKNRIETDNIIRVTLRGTKRVAVLKYFTNNENDELLYTEASTIDLPAYDETEENAIRRKLIENLRQYIELSHGVSNSILNTIKDNMDLNKLTDIITSFLPFGINKKLEYMQNINPLNRATKLIKDIEEELKYLKIDEQIDDVVRDEIENNQKEYLLRERLKAIKQELGEDTLQEEETKQFYDLLAKIQLDPTSTKKLEREIEKYSLMNPASPEISVLRNYLSWILNLPWNTQTKEEKNFNIVERKLNKSHYGLTDIKERIIEYVAIKDINPSIDSPIICLVGPPGVGKTSIARSIADALNRKFYKISVGGLNDSTELIGSRRTYLAASPGKIIQGIYKCESNNPLILIDEVDKMVKDYKGDPASTLLEILDPVQNKYFTDNYIEEPFDLSNVLFILTANNYYDIPYALIDRLEVIELHSYTLFEKKDIAKKYLLPRIYETHKCPKLRLPDELICFIINNYTSEAGVRELERVFTSLIRKLVINNIKTVNEAKVIKLLGNPKYNQESIVEETPGVVNSLAVTNNGGTTTITEVTKYKGTGKLTITGSIGKVMEESIKVAISFIKKEYGYSTSSMDLHFHFLEGGTKKDGPSAGLSVAICLLSLLEKKSIPKDIAFTGEISLNGSILKIGSLKEKLIGAYNKGIKVVYIPKSNESDLKDIPEIVKETIDIIPVSKIDEVYTNLFK